jgi:hypothetical protein
MMYVPSLCPRCLEEIDDRGECGCYDQDPDLEGAIGGGDCPGAEETTSPEAQGDVISSARDIRRGVK